MHLYYLAPAKYYNRTLSDNVIMLLQLVSRFKIDKLTSIMLGDYVMLIPTTGNKYVDNMQRVRMLSYKLLSENYIAALPTDTFEYFGGFTIYFTKIFEQSAQIDDLMALCGVKPKSITDTVKQIDDIYRGDFPNYNVELLGDNVYIFLDSLASYFNSNIHLAGGLHGLQIYDKFASVGFLDDIEYNKFMKQYQSAYISKDYTDVQTIPVAEQNSLLLRYELSKQNIASYYYNNAVYYRSSKPVLIKHDYAELVEFISSCNPDFDIITLNKFSELNTDDLLDIVQFEDQTCTIVDNLDKLTALFKSKPFSLRTTTKLTEIDLLRISLYRASYIGLLDYYFSSGVNHIMIPGKITLKLVVVNHQEDLNLPGQLNYYAALDRTSVWYDEEILEFALILTPAQRKIIDQAWLKGKLLSNYARAYWRHYGKLTLPVVGVDSFIFTANASRAAAERVLEYLS